MMPVLGNCGCPAMAGSGMGDWSTTIQDMFKSWSAAGQQILLNLNQPKVYESTPTGTTVYASSPGAAIPTGTRPATEAPTPTESIARSGMTTTIVVAGIALIAILVLFKGDD